MLLQPWLLYQSHVLIKTNTGTEPRTGLDTGHGATTLTQISYSLDTTVYSVMKLQSSLLVSDGSGCW